MTEQFKLDIAYQEKYSRSELLLRSFFGFLYLALPHYFILSFLLLGVMIIDFVVFWVIIFTGEYPQDLFDFELKFYRWMLRVDARMANLVDGYPEFGLDVEDPAIILEVARPTTVSRKSAILKALFGGIYIWLPHLFVLFFYWIAVAVISFVVWWIVLFTGKFPKEMHEFIVGYYRWYYRVLFYANNMSDTYPPFSAE